MFFGALLAHSAVICTDGVAAASGSSNKCRTVRRALPRRQIVDARLWTLGFERTVPTVLLKPVYTELL